MKLTDSPLIKILLLLSSTVMGNTVVFADQNVAPQLHIDPFVNPLNVQVVEASDAVEPGEEITAAQPRETFLWQPELRGIIRSEDVAIANIGGDLIELGMEVEGYRLIKVREQSVVFEKDGKKYPVSIDGTEEEESTL